MGRKGEKGEEGGTPNQIPLAIQIFLWRQTSPFIRPKFGKLHASTCLPCANQEPLREIKEACKILEKVLVQNIHFGLSPSLTQALQSIPRWRFVVASFPHVLHCTASMIQYRKSSILNLGTAETKLLYTLHWILLDAAEECFLEEEEKKGRIREEYIFPLSSLTTFVYLLAPICRNIRESDFEQNLRLQNGKRVWQALWEFRHPDIPCFQIQVGQSLKTLKNVDKLCSKEDEDSAGIFMGESNDIGAKLNGGTSCEDKVSNQENSTSQFGFSFDESGITTAVPSTPRASSSLATHFDIAVLRCLFISQWNEDGVFWATSYLDKRLQSIRDWNTCQPKPRKRSNSLPIPKIEVTVHESSENKMEKMEKITESTLESKSTERLDSVYQFSAVNTSIKIDQSKLSCFKSFVESKILSKSDKNLDTEKNKTGLFCGLTPAISGNLMRKGSQVEIKSSDFPKNKGLKKGNSMPSLRFCGMKRGENPQITVTGASASNTPEHKPASVPLFRSRTDSRILYNSLGSGDTAGSLFYITETGSMDLRVLLQGLHSIICKEKFSSSRVLEKILSLVTTLLELGILVNKDTKQDEEGKNDLDSMSPHSLIMDISVRILVLLGCPHNCLERNSDPPSPKLRIHCMSLLSRLLWFNKKEFKAFISLIISHRSVQFLIGFFHSYLGFCSSIPNMYSPCSNTKPSWKKRDDIPSPGFIAPFNENHTKGTKQGVQNIILATVFKKMIDKLMLQNQMICKPDNIILHQEIRQFILFVKQNHAGVFRRVLLGGVIESLPVSEQTQVHSKQFSRGDHPDSRGSPSTLYTVEDDLYKTPRRKSFFRKNQRTSGYLNETESPATRSPSEAGHKRVGTLRGEAESVQRKTSTIQTALNWITGKGGERSLKDCGSPGDSQNNLVSRKQSFHQAKNNKLSKNQSKNSRAIRKTFADKIGIKSRRKEFEFDNAEELSLNTSIGYDHFQKDQDLICIKERRLVPEIPLLRGLSRLVFILENTFPGLSPDPLLVGSILDLPKSAILSRACVLIHLAHTVHECNRGNWPIWIKQQLGSRNERCRNQFTIGGTTPKGARIQIQAGKLFHQWGEAVGNRLDDILETDEKQEPGIQTEETINKQILQDEDEDFMDEASVNPDGERCPMVLRIAACQLLLEITAYMRETYKAVPKVGRGNKHVRMGEGGQSTVVAASRRWSTATGQSHHSQEQDPRKISFVLTDQDSDSLSSSKNSLIHHDGEEKRGARLTQGNKGNLLKRAPSGNSFRRSIRLKKGVERKKESEEETLQRQDSITSKRKISSVSSEVSEQEPQEETPSVPVPAAAVAAPTIPAAAAAPIASATPTLEAEKDQVESPTLHIEDASEEDIQLEVHLPWLKTVIEITKNINLSCTHQGFCQQNCVRRLSRSCKKLMEAMKYLYGEELEFIEDIFMESNSTENEMKKGKWTRWSESASTSPDQRKESSYRRETSKDTIDSEPTEKRDRIADSANQLPLDIQPNPGFLKYLQLKVCGLMHAPLSTLNKASCVMDEESLKSITLTAWSLLMDPDVDVSGAATAIIIVASVKSPDNIQTLFSGDLNNPIADTRINGILKVQTLWQNRYQIWSRLEENGHINMKILPSQIEFTLPSPKIGIETLPLVEPAWMPKTKTKFENIDMRRRGQTIISATKSRKKQQTELVRSVLYAEADKKRKERESLQITAVPVALCAAQEPSLFLSPPDAESDQDSDTEREGAPVRPVQSQSTVAQPLLPSTVCAAFAEIIMMLDDHGVSTDGIAVYEVAYQIIWSFLVEDCNLFLKYFMEKLTRNGQEETFQIIRSLIRFIPKLPQQAAFSLYNYLIGYIMFFVRTPRENGEDMIGSALSLLWMVVHSVQGIMFKDLKQILRKEQVDASILITANVPSAKKIVVHGPQEPDDGGIPSQFPISDDIKFFQVQQEALDFFGIDQEFSDQYYLVDHKTRKIHNPWHFVRDFYFFKRSQYPQLSLVHRTPQDAYLELQKQAFKLKFVEIGKVMLIWGILKNVSQVVQRVVFLHEDLVKLPTFPRKALEAELDLFEKGDIGKELQSIDVLHKFNWIRLISRMFEAMAGNFARPEDIQLFINVINGSLALHPEEACILRYSSAAIINATQQFRNIFNASGYLLVMPSILQIYSNNLSNTLVTSSIEFLVKQLYILHRKPFLLQMFGSIANSLESKDLSDPFKVHPRGLYQLVQSLERPANDILQVMELVKMKKPLSSLDFCYNGEGESINVQECISICGMVAAYDSGTTRANEMLTVLDALIPIFLKNVLKDRKAEMKDIREIIHQLSHTMKTIIHNSDKLAQMYTGPMRNEEMRSTSQHYQGKAPYSPVIEIDDDSHSKFIGDSIRGKPYPEEGEDSETKRENFRYPRNCLLNFSADFLSSCSAKLNEINKKSAQEKTIELVDIKCYIRLNEVASSMIKMAPYDQETLQSPGLHKYMKLVLPNTDWSGVSMKPVITSFLRRLDKMVAKIHKNQRIYVSIDWKAVSIILSGVYETVWNYPHVIVSLPNFKNLVTTCQNLVLGEDQDSTVSNYRRAILPSQDFCSVVFKLISLQVLALGEAWTLEQRLQSDSFSSSNVQIVQQERGEVMLLNMLIPLILHVGGGMKNIPKLRKNDILYSLNLILGLIQSKDANPAYKGKFKQAPINVKVGFLGLRVLITCYSDYLAGEWHRIARTIRFYGSRNETNVALWKLLDYISLHRTPLYNLLLPFIRTRERVSPCPGTQMSSRLTSEVQQSRSRLLLSLQAEIEELRQEILKKKSDHLLDVNTARRGQRTSFVEYVSEVYNRHHGPHSSTSTLSSGQKDIGRGDVTTWRSVRPASSGSRYKYTGFRRKNVGRRTSYAGETVGPDINDVKINATSTSEPRLFRKGTVLRNRNRYNPTSVCENPGGSNPSGDKEVQGAPGAAGGAAGAAGAGGGGGGGQEAEEGNTEDGMTRRLQRMKAQSRKTFKFKARKKMKDVTTDTEADIEEDTARDEPVKENVIEEDIIEILIEQPQFKPMSLTSAVLRRAKQGKKISNQNQDICLDEDSISSTMTSSTLGYRDSFGENDDSCFDLLERYDNSSAILQLLQSRRRENRIEEDIQQEEDGDEGHAQHESRDQNTFI